MEEYKDHEFCKDTKCGALLAGNTCTASDNYPHPDCFRTAKDFHKWLKSNGYKIVKGGE